MFQTIRFPAAGLALALGLSACGGAPPVSIETRAIAAPAPSFEALREGPTVIVPPAVAEVQAAFQRSWTSERWETVQHLG